MNLEFRQVNLQFKRKMYEKKNIEDCCNNDEKSLIYYFSTTDLNPYSFKRIKKI